MSRSGSVDTSTVDNYHVIELVGEGSFGKVRPACSPCDARPTGLHGQPASHAR